MKRYLFFLSLLLTSLACVLGADQGSALPTPNPTVSPPFQVPSPTPPYRTVCAGLLNIRQEASPNALVVGFLNSGKQVEQLMANQLPVRQTAPDGGVWVKVRSGDIEGWINQRFLCEP